MKILYTTTIGATMTFFVEFIRELIKEGHMVDIATNIAESNVPEIYAKLECKTYQIDWSRSPLSKGNLMAIKQLKKLVEEKQYDIVHCHTPVAAMCTRIACRKTRKHGTKVFYTAHGFHFYKGAPLKNWLLYYPVERICSYWTDVLITICKEDYALAQKKMKAKRVEYVPGVGIDLEKFSKKEVDRTTKRQELGIPENVNLLLSVGELNENKNHETVIRAIADLKDVYYIIAGKGPLEKHLEDVISECDIKERVKLLGFRNDVGELCEAADAFIFPSYREGLSVSVMEAMASGLPLICSRIRGNTDLVDENGGLLFEPNNIEECRKVILKLLKSDMKSMGDYNIEKIKKFSIEIINEQMSKITGGGYYHLRNLFQIEDDKEMKILDYLNFDKLYELYARKKILVLSNADGGLYRFRKEFLMEMAHPGSVLVGRCSDLCEVLIATQKGNYKDSLNKLGCRVIDVSVDRRGMNPIYDLKLIAEYRSILDKENPDIVLTYTIKPNIYGGLLCRIKKVPYIANITGLGTAIEKNNSMSKVILFMYRLGLKSARTIFFQNADNLKCFLEKKIVKNGQLIPGSGVNLEENRFEVYPAEDGKLKFLFAGRIMRDKGICEFLDCAEYIKKKYPNTYFDILGDFDEEVYHSRVEELHKKGIIHYYGSQDDVHSFMKTHHATILPTYHEGLSNVLLESAATGRPVIASNIPGCQEIFEDDVTGIGFVSQNSAALIKAVEKFIALPYDRKKKMGISAREKVSREFDRKQVIVAYLDVMNIY